MNVRHRRRIRFAILLSVRFSRLHWVTFVSAAVLGVTGALTLTNTGFEHLTPRSDVAVLAASTPIPAATTAPPSPTPGFAPAFRRQAIVYVVQDQRQGEALVTTHGNLIWDTQQIDRGAQDRLPEVHYVVASTPELQSEAIQRLNYLIEAAAILQVDLRIVDIRPGHGVPAP
jgi:hypothetical protein